MILIVMIVLGCVGVTIFAMRCFPIKYRAEIVEYSRENGLNPALVASVINAESRFNPDAQSQKGALGLMQLLPTTAEEVARKLKILDFEANDLFAPDTNIQIGTCYLAQLIEQFGDVNTALCAYNAGPSTVRGWLGTPQYSADGVTLSEIPYPETQKYVQKIAFYQKIYGLIFTT